MSVHGPPKYVGAPIPQPSAGAGYHMAKPNESMIRPVIPRLNGGRRKCKGQQTKRRKQKGGFLPSIGQSFVAAVSKYLTPIAMYGLYKFVTRKNNNKNNKNNKNKRRATRRR
jgi:hypothetical protein